MNFIRLSSKELPKSHTSFSVMLEITQKKKCIYRQVVEITTSASLGISKNLPHLYIFGRGLCYTASFSYAFMFPRRRVVLIYLLKKKKKKDKPRNHCRPWPGLFIPSETKSCGVRPVPFHNLSTCTFSLLVFSCLSSYKRILFVLPNSFVHVITTKLLKNTNLITCFFYTCFY